MQLYDGNKTYNIKAHIICKKSFSFIFFFFCMVQIQRSKCYHKIKFFFICNDQIAIFSNKGFLLYIMRDFCIKKQVNFAMSHFCNQEKEFMEQVIKVEWTCNEWQDVIATSNVSLYSNVSEQLVTSNEWKFASSQVVLLSYIFWISAITCKLVWSSLSLSVILSWDFSVVHSE